MVSNNIPSSKSVVLSLYRELLSFINVLPVKQQSNALIQLRDGFRKNISASPTEAPLLLEVSDINLLHTHPV